MKQNESFDSTQYNAITSTNSALRTYSQKEILKYTLSIYTIVLTKMKNEVFKMIINKRMARSVIRLFIILFDIHISHKTTYCYLNYCLQTLAEVLIGICTLSNPRRYFCSYFY